jgi:hypothetical protein
MRNLFLFAAVPLMVAVVVDPLPVRAQVATSLEQAELAGLKPDVHAEVQKRLAAGGQTVSEILATMLLNNIKLKHPASRIVALDFCTWNGGGRKARRRLGSGRFRPDDVTD